MKKECEKEFEVVVVIGDGEVTNIYTNLPASIKIKTSVIDFDSTVEEESIEAGAELQKILADKDYREI